jgi:7,8-dihydropterin-6-yl-methyl-4-(beta-D-ribofuranosyl)aminobenzene 5'-phosphate synthase
MRRAGVLVCIVVLLSGSGARASELTLINAYDAFGALKAGLKHDFGFSAVARYRGKTILFDSGTDARIFKRNLHALGVDPRKIDIAIASHRHHDHIAGFDYLLRVNPRVKLYLPHDFFGLGGPLTLPIQGREPDVRKTLPRKQCYYGCSKTEARLTSSGRFFGAKVEYVKAGRQIAPGITLIATRSKLMGTFIKYPPHSKKPKLIPMPELSVSFSTSRGEVLLVGCSHSTVDGIVQSARKQLPGRKIHLVAGGYHLLPYDRRYIVSLARRMDRELKVERVAPAHCSGHLAFSIFRREFAARYLFFGLGSRLEI